MASYSNLKSHLSNPGQIFEIEVMEVVLQITEHVYFFDSPGRFYNAFHLVLKLFFSTFLSSLLFVIKVRMVKPPHQIFSFFKKHTWIV